MFKKNSKMRTTSKRYKIHFDPTNRKIIALLWFRVLALNVTSGDEKCVDCLSILNTMEQTGLLFSHMFHLALHSFISIWTYGLKYKNIIFYSVKCLFKLLLNF